jgi:pyridoxamine 5'-phosphate oxidase
MKLEQERREYRFGKLTRESLADSPFDQFQTWMDQALDAAIQDPTAMTVSTVAANGHPWSRILLLKGFDERGFSFYTNLKSRKGQEIEANPNVTLHFPWLALDRQVTIGGTASVLDNATADAYFATRPRESQVAAWVAQQSSEVASREFLDSRFAEVSSSYEDKEIPRPEFWGGYTVQPEVFEFWQGGEHRIHDRFVYELADDLSWSIRQLAP